MKKPLFKLGQLVATPGAIELMKRGEINPSALLGRHVTGDFGDLCPEDIADNMAGIENGFRVMSSYPIPNGKVWVITEADRSATTILLPDEY